MWSLALVSLLLCKSLQHITYHEALCLGSRRRHRIGLCWTQRSSAFGESHRAREVEKDLSLWLLTGVLTIPCRHTCRSKSVMEALMDLTVSTLPSPGRTLPDRETLTLPTVLKPRQPSRRISRRFPATSGARPPRMSLDGGK